MSERIELAVQVIAESASHLVLFRVGIDAVFDRVTEFGGFWIVFVHDNCQIAGFHPRLTTHTISQ